MTKFPRADDPKEVEDVLSSIRRLVSEEARALGSGAFTSSKAVAGSSQTLVLTPELRVVKDRMPPLRLEMPVPADTPAPDPKQQAPFHDELALRTLVREMIREELQGELGARITRNVRKLIKREIAEALNNRG